MPVDWVYVLLYVGFGDEGAVRVEKGNIIDMLCVLFYPILCLSFITIRYTFYFRVRVNCSVFSSIQFDCLVKTLSLWGLPV